MDKVEESKEKMKCGIIMPISDLDGCSEHHWREVKNLLIDAINAASFEAELVSEADDVGIIQKRIIQNIYENPIIVCDVSGKNPNVMFELGLRLAFDKPTIIIKDDKTNYSFDTAPIEHLTYPRDLRYSKIIEFKDKLSTKISATYQKSCCDQNYTTFLKNFGEFTTPKLETKEVSKEDFIIEEIKDMKRQLITLNRKQIESINYKERNYIGESDQVIVRDNYRAINKMRELDSYIRHEIQKYVSSTEDINLTVIIKQLSQDSNVDKISEEYRLPKGTIYRVINDVTKQYLAENNFQMNNNAILTTAQ